MYKLEVDSTLCRIIEFFYRVGVWRDEKESAFRKSCIRILYLLQYFSFFIYILTGAYSAYLNHDTNELIYLIGFQIGTMIVMVKLIYILWRKDETIKFLYDPVVAHFTENHDESVLVNGKMTKVATFIKVYTLTASLTLLFVVLFPLPSVFTSGEKMLPLFIRFTLKSDYEMVLYWMAYIYGSIGLFLSVTYLLIMLFVWYIMYNYAIEYKLLGHRIQSRCGKTYQQELIHLVRAHNKLFDTIEEFRSCFSTLFLVEMVTGAISICVSIFNLSYNTTANIFEQAYYLVFLLYAFSEIFLILYLANEITIESDRISYCLFESNWIGQSESIKKCVIIFGEIIKRPQQLAIFIYPMNLEMFTSIVNGAYSMFNIIKSFK